MTTDIIELSKQVAEILGRPAFTEHEYDCIQSECPPVTWLVDDPGACAEIAADRRISTNYKHSQIVSASYPTEENVFGCLYEELADHNNERIKAYCVAVCKAVIEQAKQS